MHFGLANSLESVFIFLVQKPFQMTLVSCKQGIMIIPVEQIQSARLQPLFSYGSYTVVQVTEESTRV